MPPRRLGNFVLPSHAEEPSQGIATWVNKRNKCTVLLIHYTADPKCRTHAWYSKAREGYVTDGAWNQEQELDFATWEGRPVYGGFSKELHVPERVDWSPRIDWPFVRGWDIGTHACVWAQLQRTLQGERLVVFTSRQTAGAFPATEKKYKQFEIECSGLSIFIQECITLSNQWFPEVVEWVDIIDPSGFNNTITNTLPPSSIFQAQGLNPIPGRTQSVDLRVNAIEGWLSMLSAGKPAFQLSSQAIALIDGFDGGYKWTHLDGVRKPDKGAFSHCLVGDTLIATERGAVPISQVRVGDRVLTPQGACCVSATLAHQATDVLEICCSKGETIRATPEHPFVLPSGEKIRADQLREGQELVGGRALWGDQPFIRSKNFKEFITTSSLHTDTIKVTTNTGTNICTVSSGHSITAQFLTAFMSIITTKIRAIMTLPTFDVCPEEITLASICRHGYWQTLRRLLLVWQKQAQLQEHGIVPLLAMSGTFNMPEMWRQSELSLFSSVVGAIRNTSAIRAVASGGSVPTLVREWHEKRPALTMSSAPVVSVDLPSPLTNIQRDATAPVVVSVKRTNSSVQVYDLTVEEAHCFYANGVLVGNCMNALEYICTVYPAPISASLRKQIQEQQQNRHSRRMAHPVVVGHQRQVLPSSSRQEGKIDW